MTKKHEELVEEVRLLWCEECADGPLGYEYGFDPEVDDPCTTGCEDLCTERARKVIALILSAVRDGLELPGEIGRAEIGGAYMYPEPKDYKADMITMQPVSWWHRTLEKAVNLENGDILIALRPLTGTGKEEEKNGDGSGRPD